MDSPPALYGTSASATYLFPFAAAFGGVAHFAAGMWAFRARDGLATAMYGTWGSFWIAYGVLYLLAAVGAITLPTGEFPELGYWFLALAVITGFGAVAALGENLAVTGMLGLLGAGCGVRRRALPHRRRHMGAVAGWVLIASAVVATYTARGDDDRRNRGRTVLPLGQYRKAANVPGGRPIDALEYELGEPGVKHGQ